jgi:hypothetical protein
MDPTALFYYHCTEWHDVEETPVPDWYPGVSWFKSQAKRWLFSLKFIVVSSVPLGIPRNGVVKPQNIPNYFQIIN